MINVRFDVGDLAFGIQSLGDVEALMQTLAGIAESTHAKWARLAQQRLHTTRQTYLLGLQQPHAEGPNVIVVELVGKLPNMIEHGASSFDLKQAMLREGGRVRVAKDGHTYRYIAMRITGARTKGAAGQPAGSVYEAPGPESMSRRRGTRAGAMLIGSEVMKSISRAKFGGSRSFPDLPKLQPQHSVNPFEGITKLGEKGNARYVVFRTMSSRIDKWHHPGFIARNLALEAAQHAQKIGPKALRALAQRVLSDSPAPPVDLESGV